MTNYKWFAGSNDEFYDYGPFDTKQEALDEAYSCGVEIIYFCEAAPGEFKLSELINLEDLEEALNDSIMRCEYDDDPILEMSEEDEISLREALDRWQEERGLKFTCQTFKHIREAGHIEAAQL